MKKYTIITIITICFLLVTSAAMPSFAMDIVGDGSSSPPPYLYSVIPIESMYIKSSSGGTTNDLDNFVINCGGYLEYGQSTGGYYECNYGNNRSVYVQTNLSRTNSSTGNWFVSQIVRPKYDLFNNNTQVQIILVVNPFILTDDFLNVFNLTCSSDGSCTIGNITYSYDYIDISENGELAIDNGIDFAIEGRHASSTYTQSTNVTNSVNLFPQSFYNHVKNNIVTHVGGVIGEEDGLDFLYDNDALFI